jgi:protein-tyrosine phosphatase
MSPTRRLMSPQTAGPATAPLAGGLAMPASQSAANPFFGNIRQNMDLVGGVGQMNIRRPQGLTVQREAALPQWLRSAADERDQGKAVAERFLQIERAEQRRMQDALSGSVSYVSGSVGSEPSPNKSRRVRIAGIEEGSKNRYNNIWPYDHARVKLENPSGDYINASHVKAAWSNKRYIATQGPMPATFEVRQQPSPHPTHFALPMPDSCVILMTDNTAPAPACRTSGISFGNRTCVSLSC